MKMLKLIGLGLALLISQYGLGQTVYSWTAGVNPGWTSSDGNLTWRAGCSAVTTNCVGNYANNLNTFYFSGAINTTCAMASTVIPTIDIAGNAEYGYDFLYMYYSYDGVNWINILGAGVGLTGNAGTGITWSYPAITTGTTVYFLFNFVSDNSVRSTGYELTNFTVDCNVVLPVELTDFEAKNDGEDNIITWKTASEINNSHFNIERSTDGQTFDLVKVEQGHGNSGIEIAYKVYDNQFEKGVINYYRLTQVDFDGKEETFDIVSVDNREKELEVLKTINLFGQTVDENYKGLVIEFLSDGTSIKRFQK